jgi:response regulator RpfG family c-di-GMP phosphodiesterase
MTYKLLIVDDELANLRLLERLFRQDYYCLTASSGEEAIQLLSQHDVAILITDQRMPQMSGIDLLKRTAELRPHMSRILLTGYTDVEALVEAINCGLVHRYITKPWNNDDLKLKVARALEQYQQNRKNHGLQIANDRLISRLREMTLGVVSTLEALLRVKDAYLCSHSARVARLAIEIAERMGLSNDECEDLALAGTLHHLGQLVTADDLEKVGITADQELAPLQCQPEQGARLLALVPGLRNVSDMILFHRENFDGSGPPRGLCGEQIPLPCRIIRVADEYDLLTRPRVSSTAVSHESALRFLQEMAGNELDPEMVRIMSHVGLLADGQRDSGAEASALAVPYDENTPSGMCC